MRALDPGAVSHLAGFRVGDGSPRLVAASDDTVSIWDPVAGERTAVFDARSGVNDIVCGPNGRDPVLAVASDIGLEWFNAVIGTPCYGSTTDDTVWGLAVGTGRGGAETVFGAGYGSPHPIHRWGASTGTMKTDLGKHDDHIVPVAVFMLPDGTELVAASGWSRTIHRWDPAADLPYGRPFGGLEGIVHAMDTVLLPDGRLLLASADSAGHLCRWDAVSGEPIGRPVEAHPRAATVLATRTQGCRSSCDTLAGRYSMPASYKRVCAFSSVNPVS